MEKPLSAERSRPVDYRPLLTSLEQAVQAVAANECPVLLGELERLKAVLWSRLVHHNAGPPFQRVPVEQENYLTVQQVSAEFHVTPTWLYRHKKRLPHSQPSRKTLLFPAAAVRRWFASRRV